MPPKPVNTLILGAGAAGLMAAAHAGPDTLVIDHAKAPGEKIRISGGGRCNFTNLHAGPDNFLSENPHFAKSALSRYTQWDFIDLVDRHGIAWHEKTLGQLFCDGSSKEIIAMLLDEMRPADLWLNTSVDEITHDGSRFRVPALVPLTFDETTKEVFRPLSGVSLPIRTRCNGVGFDEALLFTHRGLSGPAILQISSYWREGDAISLHLRPDLDLYTALRDRRAEKGGKALATVLSDYLPRALVTQMAEAWELSGNLADQSDTALQRLCDRITDWQVTPTSSEGYRTAEVTLGGVSTQEVSSRTMESQNQPGLYLIGEVMDVTGWLGGYNFQWAWASGAAAGRAIAAQR